MGWVLIVIGGLAGAVASGGITYLSMLAREEIVVKGAVKVERDKGIIACNARVGEIERVHNAAIESARGEVRTVVERIEATPEAPAEIKALCQRSSSCRERVK